MRPRLLALAAALGLLLGTTVGASAQAGPYAAQIQAALRSFVASDQTITGTWTFATPPVGSGAPADATYLTQTANATLTNEQALSSLSSGILRVATTTGVVTSLTTSAGIFSNISDETGGAGVLVGSAAPTIDSPVLTTLVDLVTTGVRLTASNGSLTLLGLGNGTDENLTLDLNAANVATLTTGTGVTRVLLSGITNFGAQHVEGTGTAPAVTDTSGGTSCGASGNPTIDAQATDIAFKFTIGTGGGTSCTVTFATAFAQAPACVVSDNGTSAVVSVTSTASAVVIDGTLVAADVISGVCLGQHP